MLVSKYDLRCSIFLCLQSKVDRYMGERLQSFPVKIFKAKYCANSHCLEIQLKARESFMCGGESVGIFG